MGKRELLAGVLDRSGVNGLLARAPTWSGLIVLNYHRIGNPSGYPFDDGLFSATEEQFAEQVRHLVQHFDVIGIDDLKAVLTGRPGAGVGRFVLITFDDGYLDNYEAAFQILRAYGAKATFFITSGFLDERRAAWWDEIAWMVCTSSRRGLEANPWTGAAVRFSTKPQAAIDELLRVYKSLPGEKTDEFLEFLGDACGTGRCPADAASHLWMTWDMVRQMWSSGMGIGGHTVSHPVLANLPADRQLAEIADGKRRIETQLGGAISAFSYPVGQRDSFTRETRDCVREAGFQWGFSYYGAYFPGGEFNPYDLPRTAVERHIAGARFRALTVLPDWFAGH